MNVLAKLPGSLHRKVKSDAALRRVKINDIIIEAVQAWAAQQ